MAADKHETGLIRSGQRGGHGRLEPPLRRGTPDAWQGPGCGLRFCRRQQRQSAPGPAGAWLGLPGWWPGHRLLAESGLNT